MYLEGPSWIYVLCGLSIVILILTGIKKFCLREKKKEGFAQDEEFVLKQDGDSYDTFYLNEYDDLMKTEERLHFEVSHILNTNPSLRESVFLDIGCGTCGLLSELQNSGFRTFGLDKSAATIKFAQDKNPNLEVKLGDGNVLMTYDKGTFTHITCMYFTIYEFKDKAVLFRNIYHWLQRGGFFIFHVVDEKKFDMIAPCAKVRGDLVSEFSKERITKSTVAMPNYIYGSKYTQIASSKDYQFEETFKCNDTNNTRVNSRRLYIESKADQMSALKKLGFVLWDETTYMSQSGSKYNHLCTFFKPN
jgi:SAM-dependent methyltransferase